MWLLHKMNCLIGIHMFDRMVAFSHISNLEIRECRYCRCHLNINHDHPNVKDNAFVTRHHNMYNRFKDRASKLPEYYTIHPLK